MTSDLSFMSAEVPTADFQLGESVKGRVMVVDDEPVARKFIAKLLRDNGYKVIEVDSGRSAIEAVEFADPELILLDCQMPDLDGFQTCRIIHQKKQFEDVPVVFVTALMDTSDKIKGFLAGGVDYITKPIEPVELLARIQTHLDLARMRRKIMLRAEKLESLVEVQLDKLGQVKTGQRRFLVSEEEFPELNLAIRFEPAAEAGGDFYEVARLGNSEYGIFIADVSGHNLEVAYMTGALKALSSSFMQSALSVEETLILFNSALYRFLPEGRFVTACYVKYLPDASLLQIASAGHPPAIIQRDGKIWWIELEGDVLGVFPQILIETRTISLAEGDRLFVYTDGLIEGYVSPMGQSGKWSIGKSWFESEIQAQREADIKTCVNTIVDTLLEPYVDERVRDDVVLLGVEFTEKKIMEKDQ